MSTIALDNFASWVGRTEESSDQLTSTPLRLMFAGVDEEAWVYLNGKQVGEHSEKSEKKPFTALYDEPFVVEVPAAELKNGEPNVLFVRVHNRVKAGGIWRPVFAIGGTAK